MSLLAAIGSYPAAMPFSVKWMASSFATVDSSTGTATITSALKSVATSSPIPEGNWYWEVTVDDTVAAAGYPVIGVSTSTDGYPGRAGSPPGVGLFMLSTQNFRYVNGTEFTAPNTSTVWTLGVAYQSSTRTATFFRGGVNLGSGAVSGSNPVYIMAGSGSYNSLPKFFAINASPASIPSGYDALALAI